MWYVSQIGRREHYALPAHLYGTGNLGLFATDIWAPWVDKLPSILRPAKFAQRYNRGLRGALVASPSLLATMKARFGSACQYTRWVNEGKSFGSFAAQSFNKAGLKSGDTVIGYTAANLEQLSLAKQVGAHALHVQVDPALAWYRTRAQEWEAFPNVELRLALPTEAFMERIQSEWRIADQVIVHSKHSFDALVGQGVDARKCLVIPPSFTPLKLPSPKTLAPAKKLRVLFVGSHCLAKGFHYYAEAARRAGSGFEFISVGGSQLSPTYAASIAQDVQMLGPKSQAEVRLEMKRADVLVFPTLSDGFGLVQLEAMAAGLPVITTSCCGEVVRHGVDGFIVPPRDAAAIVASLKELRDDPDKYAQLSIAASRRHLDFSAECHFNALLSL